MNNQEAKFILGAYRAGGQDASDATFADAMQRTQADPELGAWFTRARAHDRAVAAKLREIAPPAGLREAILAGARAGATQRAWWQRPQAWAVAASVAILLTAAGVLRRDPAELDGRMAALREFALNDLSGSGHKGHATAQGALKTWLNADGGKLTVGQPMDFAQLQANGCRTVRFGGREIAEVCFERNGLVFHLYAVPRDAMPEIPALARPAILARASRAAAVWSDSKFHYVLATGAGAEALQRLL